jgi:hypothetical protein
VKGGKVIDGMGLDMVTGDPGAAGFPFPIFNFCSIPFIEFLEVSDRSG